VEIVDHLTALVTRNPTFGEPLLRFLRLADALGNPSETAPDLRAVEASLEEAADRLVREGIARVLVSCQPLAEEVVVEGVRYQRMKEPSSGVYFSRRGRVEVPRRLYRQVGVHNGPTVVPLELRAGMVEGRWTPLAAAAAAHLLQDEPARDAVETCRALGVLPFSRSSIARTGTALGERWEEHRTEGEDHLISSLCVPAAARSVSVSVDRVSLPMAEVALNDDGDVMRDADGRAKRVVTWRMAYCGVWTLLNAEGDPLCATRYGRMPHEGHGPIEESLRGDLEALLLERPDLALVGVADGAPEMQNLLSRVFTDVGRPEAPVRVDLWHLLEKIAAAIRAVGEAPAQYLPGFRTLLREQHQGIERVEIHLRTWALACDPGHVPAPLTEALTYIGNARERMRYVALVAANLPVGSGGVEATCKTLVSTRMKRCGASWKTPGGQAVLSLRSIARSSRWNDAMDFILPSYITPFDEVQAA